MSQNFPIIIIVGPTASGKTALGVKVAQKYNAEIISADSMQIYKGMPIASAVPTMEERCGVPHHLMEFVSPNERFSVSEYIKCANQKIEEIKSRNKNVCIVGGTGLYIDCLLSNTVFKEEDSAEIRAELEKKADDVGLDVLYGQLLEKDPIYAEKLHRNDRKRIIRALEVMTLHGVTVTELNKNSRTEEFPHNYVILGLNFRDRELLYDRINRRVDIMVENGLLCEAKQSFNTEKSETSRQAIGHKELFPYFEGEEDLETCLKKIKTESRRYAKRQLTWFRKNEKINWIYADEQDAEQTAYEIIDKNI